MIYVWRTGNSFTDGSSWHLLIDGAPFNACVFSRIKGIEEKCRWILIPSVHSHQLTNANFKGSFEDLEVAVLWILEEQRIEERLLK